MISRVPPCWRGPTVTFRAPAGAPRWSRASGSGPRLAPPGTGGRLPTKADGGSRASTQVVSWYSKGTALPHFDWFLATLPATLHSPLGMEMNTVSPSSRRAPIRPVARTAYLGMPRDHAYFPQNDRYCGRREDRQFATVATSYQRRWQLNCGAGGTPRNWCPNQVVGVGRSRKRLLYLASHGCPVNFVRPTRSCGSPCSPAVLPKICNS